MAGRAAVVLDTGAVTRGSGSKNEDKERNIRKWFVDHDLIDGVILLPDNLFYNTTRRGRDRRAEQAQAGQRARTRSSCSTRAERFSKGKPKNYIARGRTSSQLAAATSTRPSRSRARSRDRQPRADARRPTTTSARARWVDAGPATRTTGSIKEIVADLLELDERAREIDLSAHEDVGAAVSDTWTWRSLGELFEIGAGKTMSAAARRRRPTRCRSCVPRTSFWDRHSI